MNTKIKPAKRTTKIKSKAYRAEMNGELHASIQTFRVIFDNIPEALIVTDQAGYVIQRNRSAADYLGEMPDKVAPEEWAGRFGFYLDDGKTHYPGSNMPLVRALQDEMVQAEEMILRRENETSGIWVSMSATPLHDDKGLILGVVVFFRDITYRKQMELSREKHARRTEELYKFSLAIHESDNDINQITKVVAAHAAGFIGSAGIIALADSNGGRLKIAAFHHPDPAGQALLRKYLTSMEYDLKNDIVGGVIQSGEPVLIPSMATGQVESIVSAEFAGYIRESGTQSVLIVPVTGRNGILGALILLGDRERKPYTADDQSFLMDMSHRTALAVENCRLFDALRDQISERISAKQALNVSEERFRSIFESATLGMKVLDLEGKILQTNFAFQDMVGRTENELMDQDFVSFVHPGDAPRVLRLFHDLIASGVPDFRLEHRILREDGLVVWVRTTFSTVKKGGGDDSLIFVVGILENVTEQKRIEAEMLQLKKGLQNNVEMERLRLAQELHDGSMQELYSAMYQIGALRRDANPQQEKVLENIKLNVQGVIQELRSIAKELRPPTIGNFGLEKAIRSHAEDFQEKHPNITVHLDLSQDRQLLPENVRLALFRIYQQSLANVVRHAEATRVQVRFTIDAEEIRLKISDNGKGFDARNNWAEFARLGHFGLAGAAERVNALGGVFKVESRPQKGTTVLVVIPFQESPES